MPIGLGAVAKCGIKTGLTSWGQVWSPVDTMIPFSEESIEETIEMLENTAIEGSAGMRAPSQGMIKIPGTLKGQLDYYNWSGLIEAAMGAVSSGVHTFVDNLTKIIRLEFEKSVSRWRFDGVMINTMEISGSKGQIFDISFGLGCRSLARSSDAFPAISLSNRSKVRFSNSSTNSRIRIADLVDALGSGDEVGWESFTLRLNNNLILDDGTNQQRPVICPVRNGFREASLDLTIPRYEADTYADWKSNGTGLQADLYFSDGTKKCHIEIPEGYIYEGFNNNVGGPATIKQSGKLNCFLNTNNTPMSAVTSEFRLTIASV